MRELILFLFVGCFSIESHADERLFNRLNKKYERNPEKALAYADKLKRKHIKQPDPYYFLARENYQEIEKQTLERKKFSSLNRAASDAYKMVKYSEDSRYLKAASDSLVLHIAKRLLIYRDTFLSQKDFDRAEQMALKYHRITKKVLPTIQQLDSIQHEKELAELAKLQIPRYVDGKYYGKPTGKEDIPSSNYAAEKHLIEILNKARKARGLGELIWDEELAKAARYHAYDMATQSYFSHNSQDLIDGKLVFILGTFKRIRSFYTGKYFVNSENIAAGRASAEDTYEQWYNSKRHNENMFSKFSKYVGVGMVHDKDSPYGYYWVFCTAG